MSHPTLRIAPSILSADFTRLADECQAVLDAGADLLHVDVMDGHYVPNLTIGIPVVQALRRAFPHVTLDVHLMISNPDDFVLAYAKAGASIVSFHPEASRHPHRALQSLREHHVGAGLAINPGTPLSLIEWLLDDIDLAIIMSVNPGFGGQKFIPSALQKITALDAMLKARGLRQQVSIEVDGGVTPHNIAQIAQAGADTFVAGSAIFNTPSYHDAIQSMRAALHTS